MFNLFNHFIDMRTTVNLSKKTCFCWKIFIEWLNKNKRPLMIGRKTEIMGICWFYLFIFFWGGEIMKSLQVNLFLADLSYLKTIVRVRALIFHSSHGPLPGSNKEIPSTSFYSVAIWRDFQCWKKDGEDYWRPCKFILFTVFIFSMWKWKSSF